MHKLSDDLKKKEAARKAAAGPQLDMTVDKVSDSWSINTTLHSLCRRKCRGVSTTDSTRSAGRAPVIACVRVYNMPNVCYVCGWAGPSRKHLVALCFRITMMTELRNSEPNSHSNSTPTPPQP